MTSLIRLGTCHEETRTVGGSPDRSEPADGEMATIRKLNLAHQKTGAPLQVHCSVFGETQPTEYEPGSPQC